MTAAAPRIAGLVLAAGAGARFGGPKALARRADGEPWVAIAARMLRDAGCDQVLVALGAGLDAALPLLPPDAVPVRVEHWSRGLSQSLRAGLGAVLETDASAVVITPVDTPDAVPLAVRRVVKAAGPAPAAALVQAVYRGEPGHPVLIGREHAPALVRALTGDRGARPYLIAHGVREVECADLWSGADIDTRPDA